MDTGWLQQARDQAARWAHGLLKRDFVIFDSETTGLEADDEFVQVGVIDSSGEVLLDSLVKPTKPVSSGAAAVHGLTALHLIKARAFTDIYPELANVLGDRLVIAYNSDFDRRILRQACRRYDLPMIKVSAWQCAMKQYAAYHGTWNRTRGDFKWQRLTDACAHEHVATHEAHAAVGDCLMTLRLIQKMAASVEDTIR